MTYIRQLINWFKRKFTREEEPRKSPTRGVSDESHNIAIDETIVFVIRETGWSLEYVRALKLSTLRRLVRELRYQKAVDEYRYLRGIGVALATWASSNKQGRRYRPEDFVGNQPTREQINGGRRNDDKESRDGGKTDQDPS